jgi:hypothetical protein
MKQLDTIKFAICKAKNKDMMFVNAVMVAFNG